MNPRHPRWQRGALPTELHPRLARRGRLKQGPQIVKSTALFSRQLPKYRPNGPTRWLQQPFYRPSSLRGTGPIFTVHRHEPKWRNGRRDGFKIHCPQRTCGFESHLRHSLNLAFSRRNFHENLFQTPTRSGFVSFCIQHPIRCRSMQTVPVLMRTVR